MDVLQILQRSYTIKLPRCISNLIKSYYVYLNGFNSTTANATEPILLAIWAGNLTYGGVHMINTRSYTASVNQTDQIRSIIDKLSKDYPNGSDIHWAYIIHNKDVNKETGELVPEHLHFVIFYPTPRKSTTLSNYFNIPEHMFCQIYNKKGILEYLTHQNEPDKYHYDKSDIVANYDWATDLNDEVDVLAEFHDFKRLREGDITAEQFVMSYNIPCKKLTFYNRLRVYTMALEHEARGACPRAVSSESVFNKLGVNR